ncbi:MAG: cupin domain-containing protein, partial [Cyanobacteria bacterium J06641_2]
MKFTSLDNLPQEAVSHNAEIKKKVMLRFGDLPHLTNFSQ